MLLKNKNDFPEPLKKLVKAMFKDVSEYVLTEKERIHIAVYRINTFSKYLITEKEFKGILNGKKES